VEIGAHAKPRLFIGSGERRVPVDLSVEQAGQLGRALLAASAVCCGASPPPEATPIENCHFPVMNWGTGCSDANGLPVLVVEVPGTAQLIFQFDRNAARECGRSLAVVASLDELGSS
jgi:hypothetical protein